MREPADKALSKSLILIIFIPFIVIITAILVSGKPPIPESEAQRAHRESYELQKLCLRKGNEPVMEGDIYKSCKPRFTIHFRNKDDK